MAEQGNGSIDTAGGHGNGNGADTQPAIGMISQYIKDLSVENPNAPRSYQWPSQPQLDVQLNINAQAIEGEVHEVALKVTVTAKAEEGTSYIVDLVYCALIGMRNVPDDQAHAFLYAEAPRILFPFVRRIVSDAVRDLGFAPLLLDPIDFQGLYVQQLNQRREQQGTGGDMPPVGSA
ncbi:protein-export chaperone SecB [Croceicoccus sp. F390]|uniref:Protein-export protein SecB n=1 Tax=Croceicoccus esteveae TaxID=3075597 RepID=A0ABU2ZGN2_9SPHN|nr:protein-export chaperone SecB [Croceicoccus sp. F390]MDT0575756.1 protein-export chaperone SecB [Croceicoccus sp. F390]